MLRGHCERVGRDYDEIEKTVMPEHRPGYRRRERRRDSWSACASSPTSAFQVAHGRVKDVYDPRQLALLGERIVPVVSAW